MEISTFEILTAPIAPVVGIPPALIPVARRVVQGYFLTISNLEPIDLQYRIEFAISLPVPADPNKILLNNAVLIVDVEGLNVTIPLTQQRRRPKVYSGFFTIPAHKTASVQLLPKLPDVLTPGLLEVRGYVSLFLPPLPFGTRTMPFPPQSRTPVKVLLNPEIRGTFLPNNFPSAANTELDFDQINYTLALASGKGLNEIPPEQGQSIIIGPSELILEELSNGTLEPSLGADNSENALMLVQLLAQLDPSEANLNDLNTVMEKLEIPVRMSSI
jgi:hypothetical protein